MSPYPQLAGAQIQTEVAHAATSRGTANTNTFASVGTPPEAAVFAGSSQVAGIHAQSTSVASASTNSGFGSTIGWSDGSARAGRDVSASAAFDSLATIQTEDQRNINDTEVDAGSGHPGFVGHAVLGVSQVNGVTSPGYDVGFEPTGHRGAP